MGKTKENTKKYVVSIRISDKEKAIFEELKQDSQKNISMLIREAIQLYTDPVLFS